MTPDFKPGKAYLIEGKGMAQVKSEIKEWFAKNEMEIVYEDPSTIEGFKFEDFFGYPLRINAQLVTDSSGVILIFNNPEIKKSMYIFYEYIFKYFPIFTVIPRVLLGEYRSNMVRFISGKKEVYLHLNLFNFLYYIFVLASGYIFLNTQFFQINIFFRPIILLFIFATLVVIGIWLIVKNISLNDKYYIEEYKGDVSI